MKTASCNRAPSAVRRSRSPLAKAADRWGSPALCVLALAAGFGCAPPGEGLEVAHTVASPAAAGSMAPHLAGGLDGKVYMSWIEGTATGHSLRFASLANGRWGAARTIAEGDDWFVNWADFPSIAALEDGTLAAHWLVKSGPDTYAYDVVVALSHDGGASWSDPIRPHDDGTETEHGFVSIVPSPEGRFELVWLDGRETAREPRGPMTLRGASLLPDGSIERSARIDARVCDCCATDALLDDGGELMVVYRDRSETEIRDVSVARRGASGWSPPIGIHDDGWEIAGCPVNGPAIAASGSAVATAWFTEGGGSPRVRIAFLDRDGERFEPPIDVDLGRPLGRVDLVGLDRERFLVSWLERAGGEARLYVRTIERTGRGESSLVAVTSAVRASGFPRMARVGNEILVAWTETGEMSQVRTALVSH